ncbi:hypothetical protein KP509_31G015800 [Ceratopteris richardii]|uniref:Rad21/Rec8-like protein C-terminal eukaryotic domain-containing protein n=1 Tax=Ceratopteris richardii TaxID=49495 RepID=A0A8T2QXM0_CERRI|nr:hypothetical protein KP509_31G015800 [Ceratopteris richardii]
MGSSMISPIVTDPWNGHISSQASRKKDPVSSSSKLELADLHPHTTLNVAEFTPDLNQEYHLPDEASTPVLADGTSLPLEASLGHPEETTASKMLPGQLLPQRADTMISSIKAIGMLGNPNKVDPMNSSTEVIMNSSMTTFQGSPFHLASWVEECTGVYFDQLDIVQISSRKDSISVVANGLINSSQHTSIQQSRTQLLQEADESSLKQSSTALPWEGPSFQTDPSSSFLTSSSASLLQCGNIQISPLKENRSELSAALPCTSQQTCLEEDGTNVSQSIATLSFLQHPSLEQGLVKISGPSTKEGATALYTELGRFSTPYSSHLHQHEIAGFSTAKVSKAAVSTAYPNLLEKACAEENRVKLFQESVEQSTIPSCSVSTSSLASFPKPENAKNFPVKENVDSTSFTSFPSFLQQRESDSLQASAPISTPCQASEDSGRLNASQGCTKATMNYSDVLSMPSTSSLKQMENIQIPSMKENPVGVSAPLSCFSQQLYSQQHETRLPQESVKATLQCTTNTSSALLIPTAVSLPQFMNVQISSHKEDATTTPPINSTHPQQSGLQQNNAGLVQESANTFSPYKVILQEGAEFPMCRTSMPQQKSTLSASNKGCTAAPSTTFPSSSRQGSLQESRRNRVEDTDFSTREQAFSEQNQTHRKDIDLRVKFSSSLPSPADTATQSNIVHIHSDNGNVGAVNCSKDGSVSKHQQGAISPHKGGSFPTTSSASFFFSPMASKTQVDVNALPYLKDQSVSIGGQNTPRPAQQHNASGDAIPYTSFQIGTGSSGFGLPSNFSNSMAGQETLTLTSPAVFNTSTSGNLTSSLPTKSGSPCENMAYGTVKNPVASKCMLRQSTGQQGDGSTSAVMATLVQPTGTEKGGSLRSSYQLPPGSSNFTLLQSEVSVERIIGSRVARDNLYCPSNEEPNREFALSGSVKTPLRMNEIPESSTPGLDSIPMDDDVLASILGQRAKESKDLSTSVLPRMPINTAGAKRTKLISRAAFKRRKVDLDSVSIIHGDVIKQQLANTEDTCREKRKAPCSRLEVWNFIKECEGQGNFDEPSLSELSADIRELYCDIIHGRESKLSSVTDATEFNALQKIGPAEEGDLLVHYLKKISSKNACPSDEVNIKKNFSGDIRAVNNDASSSFVNSAQQATLDKHLCLNQASHNMEKFPRHQEININENDLSRDHIAENNKNSTIVNWAQQPALGKGEGQNQTSGNIEIVSKDICRDQLREDSQEQRVTKRADSVDLAEIESIKTRMPSKLTILDGGTEANFEEEEQSVSLHVANILEGATGTAGNTGMQEDAVKATHLETELVISEKMGNSLMVNSFSGNGSVKQGECMVEQHDKVMTSNEEQNQLNSHVCKQGCHGQNSILTSEDADVLAQGYQSAVDDSIEMPTFKARNSENGDAEAQTNVSFLAEEAKKTCSFDEMTTPMEVERDSEMDEILVEDERNFTYVEIDYCSDEQETSIQDDSGWSTRTRNIGKYLRNVFQGMDTSSKCLDNEANLRLERLLGQRTRKEAARMFFETLVLKTKDYVHVKQNAAYEDIVICPRTKLMKTEF